jgi:hypothetical protein
LERWYKLKQGAKKQGEILSLGETFRHISEFP